MVFPNWGAISANIVNANNKKNKEGLHGSYTPTRKPTKKDWIIATILMVIPCVTIWILFIIWMKYENNF